MGSSKRTCKHVKKIHSSNRPNFGLRIDGLIRLALALDNDTAQPLRIGDSTLLSSCLHSVLYMGGPAGWVRNLGEGARGAEKGAEESSGSQGQVQIRSVRQVEEE